MNQKATRSYFATTFEHRNPSRSCGKNPPSVVCLIKYMGTSGPSLNIKAGGLPQSAVTQHHVHDAVQSFFIYFHHSGAEIHAIVWTGLSIVCSESVIATALQ